MSDFLALNGHLLWDPIGRAYARVEDAEVDQSGELVFTLSLVDAGWIDRQDVLADDRRLSMDRFVRMPTAILDTPNWVKDRMALT